jgi:uncharacterized membrane protein YkoI
VKARARPAAIASALALGLAAAPPAPAGDDRAAAARLLEEGRILPLASILEAARRHRPGHVLEVELEADDDRSRYVYEVELLDAGGVVWELYLDAATGRLLEIEAD